MRHVLGVLGVLAAGVLLVVSAAMNWRFGFYLGTTELDGFIYGSASAAADVMKALIPFLIVAAWRNKMWSQMAASAVVWLVVTAYSLTSALGHAALNRQDTAGQRVAQATAYANLQSDLERAKQQLAWVPQHRPAATVQSELSGMEAQKAFGWTKGCTRVKGRFQRNFCKGFTALKAELGSALQATKLEQRIADTQSTLASMDGAGPKAADPQAQILAKLTGFVMPGISVEDVQTGLAVFIALLLEVGSGLGMYIAFAQWRIGERRGTVGPALTTADPSSRPVATASPVILPATPEVAVGAPANDEPALAPVVAGANDNADATGLARVMAEATKDAEAVLRSPVVETTETTTPEKEITGEKLEATNRLDDEDDLSDVQKFIAERTVASSGSRVSSFVLFSQYRQWAKQRNMRKIKHGEFKRECRDSGLLIDHAAADKSAAVTFRGIAMKDVTGATNSPAFERKAA
ncbi:MAG: hypothetical protein AAFR23_08070 [Pseudomonadota bacterium]